MDAGYAALQRPQSEQVLLYSKLCIHCEISVCVHCSEVTHYSIKPTFTSHVAAGRWIFVTTGQTQAVAHSLCKVKVTSCML